MARIILGSGSPRRQELLRRIGIEDFIVLLPYVEEWYPPELSPAESVRYISREKADAIPCDPGDIVITADTMVFLDTRRLGKPRDEAEAEAMLRRLSGRDHTVMTGVSVLRGDRVETFTEKTQIHFRPLSAPEIRAYVATGEPMDKAGAYGIQDGGLVEKIEGSYSNVVGLPLERVEEILKAGLPVCRLTQVLRSFGVCVLGVADGVVRGEAIE